MNETIKAFVKKVQSDKTLQEKLLAAKNIDEAYAIASAAQPDLKKEDYVAAVEKANESMNMFTELSDDDVAEVAGGFMEPTRTTQILPDISVRVTVQAADPTTVANWIDSPKSFAI